MPTPPSSPPSWWESETYKSMLDAAKTVMHQLGLLNAGAIAIELTFVTQNWERFAWAAKQQVGWAVVIHTGSLVTLFLAACCSYLTQSWLYSVEMGHTPRPVRWWQNYQFWRGFGIAFVLVGIAAFGYAAKMAISPLL